MENSVLILSILFLLCGMETNSCLFRQSIGSQYEVKGAVRKDPTYKRKLFIRAGDSVTCDCGISDPNFDGGNLFHVFTKIGESEQSCMATPVTSNLLLTSHRCLLQNSEVGKLHAYEPWPVIHAETNTIPLKDIRVSSLYLEEFTVKEVIFHPNFAQKEYTKTQVPDDDVAIIVLHQNIMLLNYTTYCLPEAGTAADLPLYRTGNYIGSEGPFPKDKTTETRFTHEAVIMKAEECVKEGSFNVTYTNTSLCIRFREGAPRRFGGPLTLNSKGTEAVPFLMGIASVVGYQKEGANIHYAFFSNLLPNIPYIEHYAEKFDSQWCNSTECSPVTKLTTDLRSVDPYPWEAPNKVPARNVDQSCVCGILSEAPPPIGRISGGETAAVFEFPWMVFLYVNENICGASIINDRMLLTAAHCIVDQTETGESIIAAAEEILAFARIHEPSVDIPRPPEANAPPGPPVEGILLIVEQVIVYPDYFSGLNKFIPVVDTDIALLILKDSMFPSFATTTDPTIPVKMRPICLPEQKDKIEIVGKTAQLSGWGLTKHPALLPEGEDPEPSPVLKKATYPIRPLEECADFTYNVVTQSVICATSYDPEDSALQGDSGSPLSIEFGNDKQRLQIGLTSFMYDFTNPVHEGTQLVFFTNVQRYLGFIEYYAGVYEAKWCRTK